MFCRVCMYADKKTLTPVWEEFNYNLPQVEWVLVYFFGRMDGPGEQRLGDNTKLYAEKNVPSTGRSCYSNDCTRNVGSVYMVSTATENNEDFMKGRKIVMAQ